MLPILAANAISGRALATIHNHFLLRRHLLPLEHLQKRGLSLASSVTFLTWPSYGLPH